MIRWIRYIKCKGWLIFVTNHLVSYHLHITRHYFYYFVSTFSLLTHSVCEWNTLSSRWMYLWCTPSESHLCMYVLLHIWYIESDIIKHDVQLIFINNHSPFYNSHITRPIVSNLSCIIIYHIMHVSYALYMEESLKNKATPPI